MEVKRIHTFCKMCHKLFLSPNIFCSCNRSDILVEMVSRIYSGSCIGLYYRHIVSNQRINEWEPKARKLNINDKKRIGTNIWLVSQIK